MRPQWRASQGDEAAADAVQANSLACIAADDVVERTAIASISTRNRSSIALRSLHVRLVGRVDRRAVATQPRRRRTQPVPATAPSDAAGAGTARSTGSTGRNRLGGVMLTSSPTR